MKYVLDTNVCIRYLNGQSARIEQMLTGLSPGQAALCSIVRAELLYGSEERPTEEKHGAIGVLFPRIPLSAL